MEICIITLAKMVVYEARLKEVCPNFIHLKNKLKMEIKIECHAARQNNKLDKFENKWKSLKDVHRPTSSQHR